MKQIHYFITIIFLTRQYTIAAPKPAPDPQQFVLANSHQNHAKDINWSNINGNFQNYFSEADTPKLSNGFSLEKNFLNAESPHSNYHYQNQQSEIGKIDKRNHNSNNVDERHHPEFQHPYPKHIKEELIIHRPSPIIVNRKPTTFFIKHEPIIVRPAPVIFHRAPQPIRPIIVHNPKQEKPSPALRIQPIFVNVNRKKSPYHPRAEYISNNSELDNDWKESILENLKNIEMEKHRYTREKLLNDEILNPLQSKTKNIYTNGGTELKLENIKNSGNFHTYLSQIPRQLNHAS